MTSSPWNLHLRSRFPLHKNTILEHMQRRRGERDGGGHPGARPGALWLQQRRGWRQRRRRRWPAADASPRRHPTAGGACCGGADGNGAATSSHQVRARAVFVATSATDDDGGASIGSGRNLPIAWRQNRRPQSLVCRFSPVIQLLYSPMLDPLWLCSSRKDAEQPASCAEAGGSREPLERGGRQPAGEADVGERACACRQHAGLRFIAAW